MKPVQYVRALSRLNFENVFNPYSDFVEPALTELRTFLFTIICD